MRAPRSKSLETGKKNPKQERSKFTVAQILESARRILMNEALGKFSTNQIAKVAGVSVGTLYQYYKNKESIMQDLLFDTINENFKNVFTVMEEANRPSDTKSLIELLVKSQMKSWRDNKDFSRKLLKMVPKFVDITHFGKKDEVMIDFLKEKIEKYAKDEIRKTNLDVSLFLCIQAFRGAMFMNIVGSYEIKDDELENELIQMITSYLITPSERKA